MILKDINDRDLTIIGGIAVVTFLIVRHWARNGGRFPQHQHYQYAG